MTVRRYLLMAKPLTFRNWLYTRWKLYYHRYTPLETDQQSNKEDPGNRRLLANTAYLKQHTNNTWKIIGDPTEGAIPSAAAKTGIWKEELEKDYLFFQKYP